ncbi:TPA: hypothetical protein ACKLRA_001282 [Neisseria gonorrhoeae]|uniref:hypothetical protein n=1 Tax=Neisseria gonorrhoeae TaxID=485 RepID=UPI00064C62B1|nr:hypothetical protein [Neisseria gonorrhoeae]KLS50183.1 hypothetical protein M736_04795 [Neisseria gonorrhoeae MIA_2011_03-10]KLT08455.1 hypothetical protein M791_09330 [Neisseria gonorrhoeae MU_NG26]QXN38973.1 hypothetical protein KWZ00_03605 [Neisseria gonorrhoeae]
MGFLQFGLLFAAAGGVLGAVWASLQERGRPVPLDQAWTCAAAGVFAGMMTGHALDTVRALAPKVLRGYLGGLAEKLTGVKDGGSSDGKD